jgi:hypothetical protein
MNRFALVRLIERTFSLGQLVPTLVAILTVRGPWDSCPVGFIM